MSLRRTIITSTVFAGGSCSPFLPARTTARIPRDPSPCLTKRSWWTIGPHNLPPIPDLYIRKAKRELRIAYGHTSHGSQLVDGMTGLALTKGNRMHST